jgi:hypothetical protein
MPDQGSVKTRPCYLKMATKLGIAKDGIGKLTHRETITRYRDSGAASHSSLTPPLLCW